MPDDVVERDSTAVCTAPPRVELGRPRFSVVANLAAFFSPTPKKKPRRRRNMAAACGPLPIAGAAGPPPAPGVIGEGSLAVVLGPLGRDELDEVYIGPRVPGAVEPLHVIYTTSDAPPHAFTIELMEVRAAQLDYGGAVAVNGRGPARRLPAHLNGFPWNQICNPANGNLWNPTAAQLTALRAQLTTVANNQYLVLAANGALAPGAAPYPDVAPRRPVRVAPPPGAGVPAAAGILPPPLPPPAGPPVGGLALIPPVMPAGPGVVAGVPGPDGGVPPGAPGGAAVSAELDLLKEVLEKMQLGSSKGKKDKKGKKSSSSSAKEKKSKKKEKHKKLKKAHKKKKASRYGIVSSQSSTSGSDSDSSFSSGEERFASWPVTSDDRKRKLSQSHALKFLTLRFKKRGDMQTFAAKYPGALVMHFLSQARAKAGLPAAETMGELAGTELARWAETVDLKEIRDKKEVVLLAKLITLLGSRRVGEALDTLAMRLRELLLAKKEGSSWEKANVVSLLPGSHGPAAPIPDQALVL